MFKTKVNLGTVIVEVEAISVDELRDRTAELAAASPIILGSLRAVTAAHLALEAKDPQSKSNPAPPVTQPGEPGQGVGDVPTCACGVLYNDVRGKTYRSGAKAGQPYPNRFYAACDNKSCPAIK